MNEHTPEDFARLRALLIEARKELQSWADYACIDWDGDGQARDEWLSDMELCYKIDDALAKMDLPPPPPQP